MSIDSAPADVELYEVVRLRRPFSPGDVIRLLAGLALVVGGGLVARLAQSTVEGIESDLLSAFGRIPNPIGQAVLSLAQLATSLVPIIAIVVLVVRRHWRVALLLVLASLLANAGMVLADAIALDRSLPALVQQLSTQRATGHNAYPDSSVIASTTAVVTVAAPWVTRRWKRVLWSGVGALVVLRLLAVAEPAFDLLVAVGVGTVAGSLVLLAFGSPTNEPDPRELLAALRDCGFDPRSIGRLARRGPANAYTMTDTGGARYQLSLRTPDEQDSDFLERLYRSLRFRASEAEAAYTSLKRRIEHEALVLAMADRAGVRVPDAVRIGVTDGGAAFLVTRQADTRPVTAEELREPGVLETLWGQVDRLHRAGIAHRGLTLEAVQRDGNGHLWLVDFDDAQTAPAERERARDIAELITETAVAVGSAEAVRAAVDSLGAERAANALRMLQPLALPPATRARAKSVDGLLDDLRARLADAAGGEVPEPDHLERIKPRTLLLIGVSTLAFYSLLPQLANLSATAHAFRHARPLWLVGAVLASAVSYLFAAVSFQGSVADPVPFAPNVRAQLASSFAGLVGPAGAGGLALSGRFLQRAGVRPAEAGGAVAVNAVAGFAIHITLLIGFILWSGRSGVGGFSLPDSSTVLLILAAVLALVGVLAAFRPVRRRVMAPLWNAARVGVAQIGRVFRSPGRVGALFGGSTGVTLCYVGAVACCIQAFGGGLALPDIGAAYLSAVALATLAPTPGGLGALEAAMIAALTGFGLNDGIAVSATLTFRLATFWLPVLPGWASMRWMERHGEL